MEHSWRCN